MFRKRPRNAYEDRLRNLGSSPSSGGRDLAVTARSAGRNVWSVLRKPSWRRVVGGLMTVVLVGGLVGAGYVGWRYQQIEKLDLGSALGNGGVTSAMTVLLVGSDNRSDLETGQTKQFGSGTKVAGQRSDTIMLLRIDPRHDRAAIMSIPRDTYVTIAGTNRKDRINSSFENGPSTLIRTIKSNFGITVDHYAEVNFDSFRNVVNTVDGVGMYFPTPVRDRDPATGQNFSGLNIPKAGCVRLDGNSALSYVRSRHYQIQQNGRWVSDPASDLGRIQRQQDFVRRVAHKAVSQAKTNPFTLNALIGNGVGNMTIDKGFGPIDMASVAWRFQRLDPSAVQTVTLPTASSTQGGADVLVPKSGELSAAVKQFLDGDGEKKADDGGGDASSAPSSSAPETPATTEAPVNKFAPTDSPDCPA